MLRRVVTWKKIDYTSWELVHLCMGRDTNHNNLVLNVILKKVFREWLNFQRFTKYTQFWGNTLLSSCQTSIPISWNLYNSPLKVMASDETSIDLQSCNLINLKTNMW